MAINRASQYPGRWNTPDADSPQGAGKNRTAPGSNDGSYFEKVMWDDMDSLNQALFIASGIAINGAPDTGTASQHFDALVNNRWSAIGNYSIGSIVIGSDGNEYKAISANGRDTVTLDPVSAPDRTVWVQYPYETVASSGQTTRIYHDDRVEIEIRLTSVSPGNLLVNFDVTISGVSSTSTDISTTSPVDRSVSFIPNSNIDGGTLYYQTTGASTSNVIYITVGGVL